MEQKCKAENLYIHHACVCCSENIDSTMKNLTVPFLVALDKFICFLR